MEQMSTTGSGSMLERIADTLGQTANAATVYGEPLERDGVTVIPVARVRYGFGGGSGHKDTGEEGSGGGGGLYASPVGYIEIKGGAATYRPIRDPATLAPLVAISGLLALLALRLFMKRRR